MKARLSDAVQFLASFIRTRWGYRFRNREQLVAFQNAQLERFLKRTARFSPYYRARSGLTFQELPLVRKTDHIAGFADFNTRGITLGAARRVALEAEDNRDFTPVLPGDISVGCSSGTSGQATVFLVSRRERSRWAGVMLARMLSPRMLRQILNPFAKPIRIAFFLRANSNLYTSIVNPRLIFNFFDLANALETHLDSLNAFAPDILVAPASVLRFLSRKQRAERLSIKPCQVISVAETLESDDVDGVLEAWHVETQQIYQCTEGFLGYSCAHGAIHLNEEFMRIEPEWIDEERRRFVAIVSDFSRSTQMYIRFRMDDVLHHDAAACRCGRVTMRLKSIEGRHDDVLWMRDLGSGALRAIFPDQVRRAIMLAAPTAEDYRIEQHGSHLSVAVPAGAESIDAEHVKHGVENLCKQLAVALPPLTVIEWPERLASEKRRRIRCVSKPQASEAA